MTLGFQVMEMRRFHEVFSFLALVHGYTSDQVSRRDLGPRSSFMDQHSQVLLVPACLSG